jgi:hypothetical protein
MKLFKYYANWEYFKDVISENCIYFGDVSEFNDPYEEHAVFKLKGSDQCYSILDHTNHGMKHHSKICCFSKTETNYLLWSYYANKHQGFCICFNFKNVELNDKQYSNTSIFKQKITWGEVDYTNEVSEFEKMPPSNIYDDEYLNFFYKKYHCWSHEEEVRALIMSSDPNKVKIPSSYIHSIILGYKCDKEQEVKELIRVNNPKLKIKRANLSFLTNNLLIQ